MTRDLWRAALLERATPAGIAGSVALGVFMGCTPFVGIHAGLALVAATVFRLNRLWAVVGSRISFLPLLTFIALAEIETSHRLRTGEWAPLTRASVLEHGHEWLLDWCLGSIPVGALFALVVGAVAYAVAARREVLRPRRPAPAPPPSSGSPR